MIAILYFIVHNYFRARAQLDRHIVANLTFR